MVGSRNSPVYLDAKSFGKPDSHLDGIAALVLLRTAVASDVRGVSSVGGQQIQVFLEVSDKLHSIRIACLRILLFVVYLTLFFSQIIAPLFALFGVIETLFGLRARSNRNSNTTIQS